MNKSLSILLTTKKPVIMKKIVFLNLIFVLIIGGCAQNKESKAQLDELLTEISLETQNKAIVQKIFDGLNQRDTSIFELMAPDCKYYFPSASPNPITREDDIKATKTNWNAVPDIQWRIEEMIAEGDMVAARFTATGTPQEEWAGVPPSGKKFESGGIVIVRIENGKIVEQWEDFDLLGTFMQLGMELKPVEIQK